MDHLSCNLDPGDHFITCQITVGGSEFGEKNYKFKLWLTKREMDKSNGERRL